MKYPVSPESAPLLRTAPGIALATLRVARYSVSPAAPNATAVMASTPLPEGPGPQEFHNRPGTAPEDHPITRPDVPRTLTIVGNAEGITGNVVVSGLDISGNPLTETLAANGTTPVAGIHAFADVFSITLPARHAEGDAISVGVGAGLGLPVTGELDAHLQAHHDGARESTPPTVHVHPTDVSRTLVTIATPLDGKRVDILFLV